MFFVTLTIAQAQTIKIDKTYSTLKWIGEKVTGKHNGAIKFKSGEVEVKNKMLIGGTFVVDMKSMDCEDIEDEKWNKKLIEHLQSDDFFSVNKYPISTLVITNVEPLGNLTYKFTTDLTIKGITKQQIIEGKVEQKAGKIHAEGVAIINRVDYYIQYGSGSFFDDLGDRTISDEFKLEFSIDALIP